MSNTRKVLWGLFGFYAIGLILLMVIFGITTHKNNEFQPQNEFRLTNWVHLGVFSINRAVLYLFIASVLTVGTMVWIARRMHTRPNRIQTAVEVLYSLMRDNITRGNMDDTMAARWFPVHRRPVPVHLVLEPDRLYPAADEHRGEVQPLRSADPVVCAVRVDGQRVGAARARDRDLPCVQLRGRAGARADRLREEPHPRRACTGRSCC